MDPCCGQKTFSPFCCIWHRELSFASNASTFKVSVGLLNLNEAKHDVCVGGGGWRASMTCGRIHLCTASLVLRSLSRSHFPLTAPALPPFLHRGACGAVIFCFAAPAAP